MSRGADAATPLPRIDARAVRDALRRRREIALVDVREEDRYAQGHPLFAAQFAASRLELDAPWRLPRRDVPVVVYDAGEGLAEPAARTLLALGWTDVRLLDGGLQGWRQSGGELFRDVNVPSKAFGELVESERGTPSLPADAVKALLDSGADVVVLDARRYDEYRTMSIPGAISVPGAELVLRAPDLAPDPATRVIVNCAGRTRSLIGAQSLINAGLPNPVAALRNGTIGWLLAGYELDHGQQRRYDDSGPHREGAREAARRAAQDLARRAGAQRLDDAGLARWTADPGRTLYRWDVRTPEEYEAGHRPGFGNAPGGQLVQETDVYAAVRGARIVLADGGSDIDGVRAPITAHWLAQMGWEVAWLDAPQPAELQHGPWRPPSGESPRVDAIAPAELADDAVTLGGEQRLLSPRIGRYRRPYEGTDAPRAAMQAYLDWEFGLVAQLARDATHGFRVLAAD